MTRAPDASSLYGHPGLRRMRRKKKTPPSGSGEGRRKKAGKEDQGDDAPARTRGKTMLPRER